MSEQTNYLTPEMFQEFIDAIPRLPVYKQTGHPPAMPAKQFQLLFQITYYCALRISEALLLQEDDFNLSRGILRIRQAKTGANQKTSIPPPLLRILNSHFVPFSTTRQSAWEYAKKAGREAHLDIFESQDNRDIEGVWTHLFRKSYGKWMIEQGADLALVKVKLRHKGREMGSTFTYIKPDINALIKWEREQFNG